MIWTDHFSDQILIRDGEGAISVLYDIDDYPDFVAGVNPGPAFIIALTVPEPSSFALLGLSSIGIVGVRRRR